MPRSKSPAADSDSGVVSDIPAKKPDTWVKPKAPLRETGANAKTKNSDKDEEEAGGLPEKKKKKRKLFGAPPTFTWDPIMNVGLPSPDP